jgi:hypothetical protein
MSLSIANVPPLKVWVRKEYLYDLRKGHGEYEIGYWVTVKSMPGRSFYFETYLPAYSALYDKLPISAFLAWESDYPDHPRELEFDLPLNNLQYWNAFGRGISILEKNLVYNCAITARSRDFGEISADYLWTLDSYHHSVNDIDVSFSEQPEEHKSQNLIQLSNSQLALYPNNRLLWRDPSLTPHETKTPDFLVSSRYFDSENMNSWNSQPGTLGSSSDYFWVETKPEFPAGSIDLDLS